MSALGARQISRSSSAGAYCGSERSGRFSKSRKKGALRGRLGFAGPSGLAVESSESGKRGRQKILCVYDVRKSSKARTSRGFSQSKMVALQGRLGLVGPSRVAVESFGSVRIRQLLEASMRRRCCRFQLVLS